MELYISKLILFLNGFSICVFVYNHLRQATTRPKTEPLQYSHSNPLKSNAKFSLMPIFIAFASRFFCASLSATERWCCDNRHFLSSSQCCIFPVESLLFTLPGCPICAFVKYSSLAASITLEIIRNGTNTQGFCWLLKVILPFTLNEVMATMQGQN